MKRDFLGDSYDAVKRMWGEMLRDWAPLFANARYIQNGLEDDFTRLTSVEVRDEVPDTQHSILNDPDTGIRLPGGKTQKPGRTHTTVKEIAEQLCKSATRCVVTFDQSNYRNLKISLEEQRKCKLKALCELGCFAFYYVSHASFLFVFKCVKEREELRDRLINFGIPKERLERL